MYATGSTGREIAKVFDRTPQCVSGLCQQPWFQNRVAEILSEHSLSVLELFRAETVHCLQVLIEIMDDHATPADARDEDNFRRPMPAEKRRWGSRILRHLSR